MRPLLKDSSKVFYKNESKQKPQSHGNRFFPNKTLMSHTGIRQVHRPSWEQPVRVPTYFAFTTIWGRGFLFTSDVPNNFMQINITQNRSKKENKTPSRRWGPRFMRSPAIAEPWNSDKSRPFIRGWNRASDHHCLVRLSVSFLSEYLLFRHSLFPFFGVSSILNGETEFYDFISILS